VLGTVENTIVDGVFVKLASQQIGFAPKNFLEVKENFQDFYYKNRTVHAFIRKVDKD